MAKGLISQLSTADYTTPPLAARSMRRDMLSSCGGFSCTHRSYIDGQHRLANGSTGMRA